MKSKTKLAYVPITDEALARIEQETKNRDEIEPRVAAITYSRDDNKFVLAMRDGTTISFGAHKLPALQDATEAQLRDVAPVSGGSSIHWLGLDVQVTTIALLQILFRIRDVSEVARNAGRARSIAKSQAARENGRKGGRPRKALVA